MSPAVQLSGASINRKARLLIAVDTGWPDNLAVGAVIDFTIAGKDHQVEEIDLVQRVETGVRNGSPAYSADVRGGAVVAGRTGQSGRDWCRRYPKRTAACWRQSRRQAPASAAVVDCRFVVESAGLLTESQMIAPQLGRPRNVRIAVHGLGYDAQFLSDAIESTGAVVEVFRAGRSSD